MVISKKKFPLFIGSITHLGFHTEKTIHAQTYNKGWIFHLPNHVTFFYPSFGNLLSPIPIKSIPSGTQDFST